MPDRRGGRGSNQYGSRGDVRAAPPQQAAAVAQAITGQAAGAIAPARMLGLIKERCRERARIERHRYTVEGLEQQFIIGRFVDRVFTTMPDDWMLKGGFRQLVALDYARYSTDGDLQAINAKNLDDACQRLIAAAGHDLDDHLKYEHARTQEFDNISGAAKMHFTVGIATGQPLGTLEIDVSVVHRAVTGPESIASPDPLGFPELARPAYYYLYPTANQMADKVAAMLELVDGRASHRYHDLTDLEILARQQPVDGTLLLEALLGEFDARSIERPREFNVPDDPGWARNYARHVAEIPELANHTFDEAMSVVKQLIDPVLDGNDLGTWNPARQRWE